MSTLNQREGLSLKICQISRADRVGRIRYLTRKELLHEVNTLNKTSHDVVLSPAIHRQQSRAGANLLRARDVRKVDPNFSTRLEPAILVRALVEKGRARLKEPTQERKLHFIFDECLPEIFRVIVGCL